MENEKIIEIKGLSKKFKSLTAVDNLNLNVLKGDVFGFLGPNGAGKSTTIRMMLTLIKPNSGSIKLFGESLNGNRNKLLGKIGAIVEKPDLYGYLSAYKNLEILGKISGCDVSQKRIMEILELVGLSARAKSKVKTFSHGMKQRLGIAQALLHDPELIILDEPTTGLDPQGMKEIRELILNLSREKKKTIFLSSHILHEVELVANRMIIINKGKTVIEGYVDELLKSSTIKVTVEVDNGEKMRSLITGSGWGDKLESSGEQKFVFLIDKNEIPLLVKYLVDCGVNLQAVIPQRSLEEYFLNITEKN
ncbi:MAG TPA: ABC transporter ATP-binding protein [Ignavibacteriaceae bacterium]|nr:ABC transporter ATP-binding protein [Ignavibacteriaceae bacterium]